MKNVRGLRWWIVGLVAVATVINYIDRSSLAIMWPDISKDLDFSKEQYAAILSFFMVAYAISHSLSGRLYDVVGTRIGFVLSHFSYWEPRWFPLVFSQFLRSEEK